MQMLTFLSCLSVLSETGWDIVKVDVLLKSSSCWGSFHVQLSAHITSHGHTSTVISLWVAVS